LSLRASYYFSFFKFELSPAGQPPARADGARWGRRPSARLTQALPGVRLLALSIPNWHGF
jgi:hypothetical protein